jgi:dynein heavy chain
LSLFLENLKFGLLTETKAWRLHYGKACNTKYRTEMDESVEFVDELSKKLSRPIKDLDDIRIAMAALKEIRNNEIRIDMGIMPIEESYAMLNKHELPVPREEAERVDTIRYSWEKLQVQASEVQTYLLKIQPNFRTELIDNVVIFVKDCSNFYSDYNGVRLPTIFFFFFFSVRSCLEELFSKEYYSSKVL